MKFSFYSFRYLSIHNNELYINIGLILPDTVKVNTYACTTTEGVFANSTRSQPEGIKHLTIGTSKITMQLLVDELNVTLNGTDPQLARLANVAVALRTYFRPLLILFGIVGNVTSVAAFSRARFKKHPSVPYLQGLASSDTLFLVVLQVVWMSNFKLDLYNSPGWCQVFTCASQVFNFIPVWIFVAFGVDRILYVRSRDTYSKWCTPLRSKVVVYSLLIVAIVVYLNISILSGVTRNLRNHPTCSPLPRFRDQIFLLDKMGAVVNVLVPYSMVCILGVIIGVYYCWYGRRVSINVPALKTSSPPNAHWASVERQLVLICLALIMGFVVLTFPSALLRLSVLVATSKRRDLVMDDHAILWQQVFLHMYFTRFALNFPIYISCSSAFRNNCADPFLSQCVSKNNNKRVDELCLEDSAKHRASSLSIYTQISPEDAPQVSSV